MSCDTEYQIRVYSNKRKTLVELKNYLKEKKDRWEAWSEQGKGSRELVELLGESSPADVVCWGYAWDKIEKVEGGYLMKGSSWANENAMNVPIRWKEGELASIAKKFPDLDWEVEYSNEYDEEGVVYGPDFEG